MQNVCAEHVVQTIVVGLGHTCSEVGSDPLSAERSDRGHGRRTGKYSGLRGRGHFWEELWGIASQRRGEENQK